MTNDAKLATDEELTLAKRERAKTFVCKKVEPESLPIEEASGWELDTKLKTSIKVRKEKSPDERFENRVWLLLNKMGFPIMNKDRHFKLLYGSSESSSKQIDVFAADSETMLFLECKTTLQHGRKSNLKKEIESIVGQRSGLIREANRLLGGKKRKAKFILATENYSISDPDKERLTNAGIIHFGDKEIEYYEELADHLGPAARYQLLGFLFAGTKIPDMHNVVPAIEGTMGGHKYYSFSIEPEKLLKLGYVLHRNSINDEAFSAYQRLIKRTRLKSVQKYIKGGGFFPNSIIVNVEANKLAFERSSLQDKESISKIGLLHLPQKYRSIYIIDGQHRLYGYSGTQYSSSNTIPVVAFVNLEPDEQIKMFMDVNENQKQVSKNLRNTLNADMKWNSPLLAERREAMRLRVAQNLGADANSPLYQRIVIGENKETGLCYLTLDAFSKAIAKTSFLNTYDNNNRITKAGYLDQGDASEKHREATVDLLYEFLKQSFRYLQKNGNEVWELGKTENGALLTNSGIQGLIRVFDDLVSYLVTDKAIIIPSTSPKEISQAIEPYLDALLYGWIDMPESEKERCRKAYGDGGSTYYWMTFRRIISNEYPKLPFEELDDYWKKRESQTSTKAYALVSEIESCLRNRVHQRLLDKYQTEDEVIKRGIPREVAVKASDLATKKFLDGCAENKNDMWGCLYIIDYRTIIERNWALFQEAFTRKGEERIAGGKDAKTKWLVRLNDLRNKVMHPGQIVTDDDIAFLLDIHAWLISQPQ